jgi:hypothetical protein
LPVEDAPGGVRWDVKAQRELAHLLRFKDDLRAATGLIAFDDEPVRGPTEPPDFVVHKDGREVGLELTQLTLRERREANGLLVALRQSVLEDATPFTALRGWVVSIWFENETGGLGLPPKRTDAKARDELLAVLASHSPAEAYRALPFPLPDKIAIPEFAGTPSGASFRASPMEGAGLSRFQQSTGFELMLAYSTLHTAPEGWATLRDLIGRKDVPQTQELLVSVGAPDASGGRFSSESVLLELMLKNPEPVQMTRHLERVHLHDWGSGLVATTSKAQ